MFKKLSFSTLGSAFMLFAMSTAAVAADSEMALELKRMMENKK